MSPRDHDGIRATLGAERDSTVSLIEALSSRLQSVVEATADSSSDDEHDPEGTTLAVERGQIVAQLDRSRVRLDEIDAAFGRLDHGTYGRCESCGESIGPERLDALPAARHCIDCATRNSARRW
ncbi:TraR/DksA family transcriptional regulator [Gordonia sp. SL306]|uniref:TraR/DksA family transcriptional regulator n=1 Tax=Gordonia sp. SL306 TaxID=2995145 RepID=UPI003B63AAE0